MMKRMLIGTLALAMAFSLGFITDSSDNYFEISKNLDIFGKLYREINANYVDDIDPSELMQTGVDAMLNTLDPYTTYISEEEVANIEFLTTGQYSGIGALIGKRDDRIMVMEPYEGYPADQAGLIAGDVLLQVAGTPVDGSSMEITDVRNLLRGEAHSEVDILVQRGDETITLTVRRDRIAVPNVPYFGMIRDGLGYIALTGFTQDAGQEVAQALKELKSQGNLRGVILDLRGNPGGRLDEAVNVTNVFIDKDELVVETRGRISGSKRKHFARKAPIDTELPLVVLVNGRSASASEIVAGAVQDLDRGLIIGRRSFGKGLVQNIRPLSYNTQLKVTTAKYYTPSGRCIQAINYAERHSDGSVARIPDSLKHSFTTRNGRTVYDGGGIEPDLEVKRELNIDLIQELDRQGLIFDFATEYFRSQPQFPGPRRFEVTDAMYEAFITYVNDRNFTYQTEAEERLAELEETVAQENYADDLAGSITRLKRQLAAQKDLDLREHRPEIVPMLRKEIVKRYAYEAGALQAAFVDDPDILAAMEALSDASAYRRQLNW